MDINIKHHVLSKSKRQATNSKLKLWDHKTGNSQWVKANDLKKISEMRYVIEYITKDDRRIIPQATPSAIENDVDLLDDVKDNFSNNQDDLEANDQLPLHILSEGRQLIINGEIRKDRYGRFRYTKIRYWSENLAHYQDEFKKAIKSINLLISKYRIHTGSYWITNVTEQEFFIYKSTKLEHILQVQCYNTIFSQILPVENLRIVYVDMSDIVAYRIQKRDLTEWIRRRIQKIEDCLLDNNIPIGEVSGLCEYCRN